MNLTEVNRVPVSIILSTPCVCFWPQRNNRKELSVQTSDPLTVGSCNVAGLDSCLNRKSACGFRCEASIRLRRIVGSRQHDLHQRDKRGDEDEDKRKLHFSSTLTFESLVFL